MDGAGDAGGQSNLKPRVSGSSGHIPLRACAMTFSQTPPHSGGGPSVGRMEGHTGPSDLPAKSNRFPESVVEPPKVKISKAAVHREPEKKRLWFKVLTEGISETA